MKRIFNLSIIALAAMFAACTELEMSPVQDTAADAPEFIACIDDATLTKTAIDGFKVQWLAGDEISVNGKRYVAEPYESDPRMAKFTLKEGQTAPTGTTFRAAYPASNYSSTAGRYTFGSSSQTSKNDGSDLTPMYAVADAEGILRFKNVGAVLALDLKGDYSVKSLRVAGATKQYVRGTLTNVAISEDGVLSYTAPSSGATYYTINYSTPLALNNETATRVYVHVPQGTYTLSFTVTSADGRSRVIAADKSVTVEKNKMYNVGLSTTPADLEIKLAASNITYNSARLSFTPASSAYFFWYDYMKKSEYDAMGGDFKAYSLSLIETLKQYYEMTTEEVVEEFCGYGSGAITASDLDPETEYIFAAAAMSADGKFISDVYSATFTTLENPYAEINYEDMVGEWNFGGSALKFSANEDGKTYTLSGAWNNPSGKGAVAVLSADKKGITISEQIIDATANEYLTGVFRYSSGYYYAYPFNSDEPDVVCTIRKSKEGEYIVEAGTWSGSYPMYYFDIISYDGVNSPTEYFEYTIPSSIEPYVPVVIPADLLGNWVCPEKTDRWGEDTYTNWVMTLKEVTGGIEIENFDIGMSEIAKANNLTLKKPVAVYKPASSTITIADQTSTGLAVSGDPVTWRGATGDYYDNTGIVYVYDAEAHTLSLQNDTFMAVTSSSAYSGYDKPLVFYKEGYVPSRVPAAVPTVDTQTYPNVAKVSFSSESFAVSGKNMKFNGVITRANKFVSE